MDSSKYLGLLRWSLNYVDGTSDEATPMDPLRRDWLKKALEENVVDPADQMKSLIKVIQLPKKNESSPKEKEEFEKNLVEALEHLQEWCESLDWAQDLHKMNGFETVIGLMKDNTSGENVRCAAYDLFATVVANNPNPQQWAVECGTLPFLMTNLSVENVSEKEQAKKLLALSNQMRDNTESTVSFIKEFKGVKQLFDIVQSYPKHPKSVRKALFLLHYLLTMVPAIGVVSADQLVQMLNVTILSENVDIRENALQLMVSVFQNESSFEKVEQETKNQTVGILVLKFKESNNSDSQSDNVFFNDLDDCSKELADQLLKLITKPSFKQETQEKPMMLKM